MGVLNTNTGEVFFNLNKSFSVKGKHQLRSSKQKPAYTNLMIRSKQYRYLNPKVFFLLNIKIANRRNFMISMAETSTYWNPDLC